MESQVAKYDLVTEQQQQLNIHKESPRHCREPAWGIPPMAKVMRKEAGQNAKTWSGFSVPPGFSWTSTPQNQSLPALLYCAFHSSDILWKKLTQGFSLVHMKGMFQLTQGFSLLHMKGMFQLKPLWWLSNLLTGSPGLFTTCELLTAPQPWEAQSLKAS